MKFSAKETLESFGLQEMSYQAARDMANEAYASWKLNPSSQAMRAIFADSIPLIVKAIFGSRSAIGALYASILDPEGLIAELYLPIVALAESHDDSLALWSSRLALMAPLCAIDVTRRREYRRAGDSSRGKPALARVFCQSFGDDPDDKRSSLDFAVAKPDGEIERFDDRDELAFALAEVSPRNVYAVVRFAEGTAMRDIGAELGLSESRVCQIAKRTNQLAATRLGIERGSDFARKNRRKFKAEPSSGR